MDLFPGRFDYSKSNSRMDLEALLLRLHSKLDETYIEDWLVQFAEALDKPEVLAEYKKLLEKIKSLSA